MKKNLLAATAIALALSAGAAVAADLPSHKAPPAYAPPPLAHIPVWTGLYAGVNAGANFGESLNVNTFGGVLGSCDPAICENSAGSALASSLAATSALPVSLNGFLGGGQVGYNFQYFNFVVGAETDIQGFAGSNRYASATSVSPPTGIPGASIWSATAVNKSIDYLGTARLRAGYLIGPSLLAYVTGGLAYGGVGSSANILQGWNTPIGGLAPGWGTSGRYSDTRLGYTIGGGLEWMVTPNWSVKGEYLYYDLGKATYSVGALANPIVAPGIPGNYFTNAASASTRFDGHITRVGVNYHF